MFRNQLGQTVIEDPTRAAELILVEDTETGELRFLSAVLAPDVEAPAIASDAAVDNRRRTFNTTDQPRGRRFEL